MHCLAGISRSVTVTVAYLMQKLNLSLNDAYDFVKRKKSNISPNFNFMGQLLDFERTLGLNSPTCDNRSPKDQMFFTTPTNHNVFQLDTLESTWKHAKMNIFAYIKKLKTQFGQCRVVKIARKTDCESRTTETQFQPHGSFSRLSEMDCSLFFFFFNKEETKDQMKADT